MRTTPLSRHLCVLVLAGSLAPVAWAADESKAKVQSMPREAARERLLLAIAEEHKPSADQLAEIAALWSGQRPMLDAVVLSWAVAAPDIRQLIDNLRVDSYRAWSTPELLSDKNVDAFLRTNLATYLGRELVRRQYIDEALTVLELADEKEVVDPAALFFHLAVCRFQLQQASEALAALEKLDTVADVPQRYQGMAELLRSSLETLKREELSGIAHDMRDVGRRLSLGRTDKRVRDIEIDVFDRLDKMIKEIEKQQQQGANGPGGIQSQRPANDSTPMGGNGPGKVGDRTFKNKDAWGNLPEKQREKAMQDIGRDFPAHYRDAIEEYFRKLAGSKARAPAEKKN